MQDFDLDCVRMTVVKTAAAGVVDRRTIFEFQQSDGIVAAEYAGGAVAKGFLVGAIEGAELTFRYCQIDHRGNLDGGVSHCSLERLADGRIKMTERFAWESRDQTGENIFEQLLPD